MPRRTFTLREIEQFKREAKKAHKHDGVKHVEALNRIAVREGYESWWQLQQVADDRGGPRSTADRADGSGQLVFTVENNLKVWALRTPATCSLQGKPFEARPVFYAEPWPRSELPSIALGDANEVVAAARESAMAEAGGMLRVGGPSAGGWFLTTLLERPWTSSDTLAIDRGAGLDIVNPHAIFEELRTFLGGQRLSEIQRLSDELREKATRDWDYIWSRSAGSPGRKGSKEPVTEQPSQHTGSPDAGRFARGDVPDGTRKNGVRPHECPACGAPLSTQIIVERVEPDEDATEGQWADYLMEEEAGLGDNWTEEFERLYCAKCESPEIRAQFDAASVELRGQ